MSALETERQSVHRFDRTVSVTQAYTYLLSLPDGYGNDAERRWPLLLFLHGAGERGDDIRLAAKHGPPKLLREDPAGPAARMLAENFIVVSPQCPKGQWWNTNALLALLDGIMAEHRVDPARVYLTGLSMGGYGTWELGTAHPARFAAIVPICGGGNFLTAYGSHVASRDALHSLGVWAFHGARDETVPLSESERMVALLRNYGVPDVRFSVDPEARHDSWTAAYADTELYHWLLGHAR